jgi:hypothetical protein
MPIKVKQTDGTVKIVKLKVAAGSGIKAVRALAAVAAEEVKQELPLCSDCGARPVTAKGMKYCEPCK